MTPRRYRRLYLLAAGSVGAVVTLLLLVSQEPRERAGSPPPGEPLLSHTAPPVRQRQRPLPDPGPARGTEPPNPASGRGARRQGERIARRFLKAFLRYERGGARARLRGVLLATATRTLADELLRRPVRATGASEPGHLARLSLYGPLGRELKASAEVAYPRLGDVLVELVLSRRANQWRVTRVDP